MDSVIVDSQGQITLPASMMKKMGIEKGGELFFCIKEGEYILKSKPLDPLKELQRLCKGIAEERGWKTEEDVYEYMRRFKKRAKKL